MSKDKHERVSDFQMEGRFLGFVAQDGYKLKYLRLSNAQGEYLIKISKELRATLWRTLTPGEWIEVSGCQKLGERYKPVKFKAYQVTAIAPGGSTKVAAMPPSAESEKQKPFQETILVCQKSDCCRRGGLQITQALQTALSDRSLNKQVVIKGTGCMKRCKAGPNIVMPDKTRYSGFSPNAIPQLVDKHFHPPTTSA